MSLFLGGDPELRDALDFDRLPVVRQSDEIASENGDGGYAVLLGGAGSAFIPALAT